MFSLRSGNKSTKVYPEEEATFLTSEATPTTITALENNVEDEDVNILRLPQFATSSVGGPSTSISTSGQDQGQDQVPGPSPQRRHRRQPSQGQEVGQKASGSRSMTTSRLLEWDEIVEDLDIAIEDTKTKSEMYRLKGEPLKKVGTGLHLITGEIMKSYGLEFLSTISEIILEAEGLRLTLPEVLDQLKYLELKKASVDGGKLIIWVNDESSNEEDEEQDANKGHGGDRNGSFCRMVITELLRLQVEPEIVLPCHDMDEDVLVCLVHQVRRHLSLEQRLTYGGDQVEFAKGVILQLLRIGLSVSLAAETSKIIIIDTDSFVHDEPHFLALLELAEELGHTVMYFRNTLATDKVMAAEKFTEKVLAWHATKTEVARPMDMLEVKMFPSSTKIE